jgi:hypothetical protein
MNLNAPNNNNNNNNTPHVKQPPPPSQLTFVSDYSSSGATPYYDAVAAKFNNNQSAWADSAVARLTSWNLNTLGAWGDTMVITKGMPYTRVLGFGSFQGAIFPDVYDPAWEASTLEKAKAICEPLRNDPNLIGYFLDNEMMWGPTIQGWWNSRFAGTLLDLMLTVYNKTAPGNIKAVNFLKGRYATIQALNTAWYHHPSPSFHLELPIFCLLILIAVCTGLRLTQALAPSTPSRQQ